MLDLTGIVFGSILMLMVVVLAVRQRPWLQPIKVKVDPASHRQTSGRR